MASERDDAFEAAYAEARTELEARGYRDIEEHNGLRVGARVRNYGEQYYAAISKGTGVVRALMQRDPSSWSNEWGRPDIEVLVERDKSHRDDGSRVGRWADYGTVLATRPEPT